MHNLFQQRVEDLLVVVQVDQLAEPDQVAAHEELQFLALLGPLLALPGMTLVLQAHPQLVHLDKVGQDEADGVLEITLGPLAVARRKAVASLAGQIVAQEEAADGVLDAATHLHHVLHDLLDGRILNGHVDGADGDHEVQARDDVAGILDEFVEVGEVVDGVVLAQVDGEMAQGIEDGHVQLVVLLGAEAAGAQFGHEGRAIMGVISTTKHHQRGPRSLELSARTCT